MFDIVFSGQVRSNVDIKLVKAHIASLLKLDSAKLQVLFSGKKTVIKSGLDKETALKYQKAFSQRGAILHIIPKDSTGEIKNQSLKSISQNQFQETKTNGNQIKNKLVDQKSSQKPASTSKMNSNLRKLESKADDPYKAAFNEVDAFDFGLKGVGESLSSVEKEEIVKIENKYFSFAPEGSDMEELDNKKYEKIEENNFLKV